MMRLLAMTCLSLAMLAGASSAQTDLNAGALAHAVDRLATTTRVLYIAAHPDDENTRLLAYLANTRHATVAYLSMTRGGGGQNLIGGEQGVLLDVIRTEELLAARRIDGAHQFFTRMRDFGFTKRAGEALAAAADPKRFPEQLARGVTAWRATRLLQNLPSWPGAPPPPKDALFV